MWARPARGCRHLDRSAHEPAALLVLRRGHQRALGPPALLSASESPTVPHVPVGAMLASVTVRKATEEDEDDATYARRLGYDTCDPGWVGI